MFHLTTPVSANLHLLLHLLNTASIPRPHHYSPLSHLELSTMADRNPSQQRAPRQNNPACSVASFLRKLHSHSPNPTQLLGFFTLFISGCILLLLTGVTITAAILGLIFFAPLILLSSPIWVPIGIVIFIFAAAFLSMCGFGVVVVAVLSWMYRYFRGLNPPGSGQLDYARSQIYNTASHVKDYAREYGGYLQSKVKDAAPGA